jgi:hypothetical protein
MAQSIYLHAFILVVLSPIFDSHFSHLIFCLSHLPPRFLLVSCPSAPPPAPRAQAPRLRLNPRTGFPTDERGTVYGYINVNGRGMTIPVSEHMLAMLDSARHGDYELDMDFDGGGDIGNAIRHAA